MMRVRGDVSGLAGVTAGALTVGEPVRQRTCPDVSVFLAGGVGTTDTGQRAAEVAVAEPVVLLVCERAYPPVREPGFVAQRGQSKRVVRLQVFPRQIAGAQHVLHRMTLEADGKRLVLGECDQRPHTDVRRGLQPTGAHQLHVTTARSMTGLAVDAEVLVPRLVGPDARVRPKLDLAPVAFLAVGETRVRTEDPLRGPVHAGLERDIRRDRNPALIPPAVGIAEPHALPPNEIERQEADGAG